MMFTWKCIFNVIHCPQNVQYWNFKFDGGKCIISCSSHFCPSESNECGVLKIKNKSLNFEKLSVQRNVDSYAH